MSSQSIERALSTAAAIAAIISALIMSKQMIDATRGVPMSVAISESQEIVPCVVER